ncbi:hypothetical protein ACFSJY_18665 [Thalassotalea euphylliae]|uniref:hypothetical protein n=1 Tax=Thalassotalea euphylliae TaxID=1655234 RepID=UPI00362CB89C
MRILILILLLLTFSTFAKECKVEGKAIWWSYDLCLTNYETDDTLHPEVLKCVDILEKEIETLGACKAKMQFKSKLCKQYSNNEIELSHCLNHNIHLGPTVQDGGI